MRSFANSVTASRYLQCQEIYNYNCGFLVYADDIEPQNLKIRFHNECKLELRIIFYSFKIVRAVHSDPYHKP